MRKLLTAATLLAAAGWWAPPAIAQQGAATSSSASRRIDTPADRFGFFEGEQLQVSNGTDDDNMTFRIALPTGPAIADRFSLSMATPLHGGDEAMPASLDALANGTRVTLSWGHFQFPSFHENEVTTRIAADAQVACRAAEPGDINCNNTGYAVRNHAGSLYPRYLSHGLSSATDYGLEATVGINDFEWTDPVARTPQQARRTDWSVAGHIAHYLPGTQTAFTGSISYQRAYEAAKEQLLCPPNPANPATDCVTARAAAPTRNENLLLSAGLRHRLMGNGILLNLAVAPVVTYEVLDDVWGVDVPVYFIPGREGGLNGGVRFGYRSDRDDKFTVGVFVGQAF
jgi:hypothetical protein